MRRSLRQLDLSNLHIEWFFGSEPIINQADLTRDGLVIPEAVTANELIDDDEHGHDDDAAPSDKRSVESTVSPSTTGSDEHDEPSDDSCCGGDGQTKRHHRFACV